MERITRISMGLLLIASVAVIVAAPPAAAWCGPNPYVVNWKVVPAAPYFDQDGKFGCSVGIACHGGHDRDLECLP
ncbi:MAG TPA: hypothetical protein VI997_09885 [Candidatus Thermoplasmatota archaeon]|nr:hypothetical protein [Candidatus Thermoplasmatota archaeon]